MTSHSQEGSASVLVAGIAAAAVSILLVLALGLGFVVQRAAAQRAADLAALSGAGQLVVALWGQAGQAEPCEVAAKVAKHNQADLASCEVAGLKIKITATVPSPWGSLHATAIAGPSDGETGLPGDNSR